MSESEEDRKFCPMFILAKDLWDSLSLSSHFYLGRGFIALRSDTALLEIVPMVPRSIPSCKPKHVETYPRAQSRSWCCWILPQAAFLRQSDRDWAKRACLHSYKARPRCEAHQSLVGCVSSHFTSFGLRQTKFMEPFSEKWYEAGSTCALLILHNIKWPLRAHSMALEHLLSTVTSCQPMQLANYYGSSYEFEEGDVAKVNCSKCNTVTPPRIAVA